MSNRLQGKVAIVTGGGGGFGKGIAEKYAAEGATVVIADFAKDVGEKTAGELKCDFQMIDVTKRADWEAMLKAVDEKHGHVDIIVNNAGTTYRNKACFTVSPRGSSADVAAANERCRRRGLRQGR